ncbi:MAG: DUF3362 domain-containing protein, partial [Lachnospiraceae bacterium]|nr:DUF3362 domain-containing protein [Lachnospiraceae bacterium]
GYMPEQVQDFYPTPSTMSTVMYYTGINPDTMKPVYVCRNPHEKAMQRALIQYRNPKNYDLVYEALVTAGREDLIGYDKKCLIRPRKNTGATGGRCENKDNNKPKNLKSKVNNNHGQSGRNAAGKGDVKQHQTKKKTIRNVHKKKEK